MIFGDKYRIEKPSIASLCLAIEPYSGWTGNMEFADQDWIVGSSELCLKDLWCTIHGTRSMVHDPWYMIHGPQIMNHWSCWAGWIDEYWWLVFGSSRRQIQWQAMVNGQRTNRDRTKPHRKNQRKWFELKARIHMDGSGCLIEEACALHALAAWTSRFSGTPKIWKMTQAFLPYALGRHAVSRIKNRKQNILICLETRERENLSKVRKNYVQGFTE